MRTKRRLPWRGGFSRPSRSEGAGDARSATGNAGLQGTLLAPHSVEPRSPLWETVDNRRPDGNCSLPSSSPPGSSVVRLRPARNPVRSGVISGPQTCKPPSSARRIPTLHSLSATSLRDRTKLGRHLPARLDRLYIQRSRGTFLGYTDNNTGRAHPLFRSRDISAHELV